jgi:hypothetical protein
MRRYAQQNKLMSMAVLPAKKAHQIICVVKMTHRRIKVVSKSG